MQIKLLYITPEYFDYSENFHTTLRSLYQQVGTSFVLDIIWCFLMKVLKFMGYDNDHNNHNNEPPALS